MAKNKLSIDLTDSNKEILETIKNERKVPYGNTINMIIELFCTMPRNIKNELFEFCKYQINELHEKMKTAGEYEYEELLIKSKVYMNLASFFNEGRNYTLETQKEPAMRKVMMKEAVLLCPSDYILLNVESAANCKYASVVEVRDAEYGVPHFVFFSNCEVYQYDANIISRIHEKCVKEWPRFQDILDREVEPIFDPDNKKYCINEEEYMKSPKIGHFAVYVQGDSAYPRNFKPPMGTRIVRNFSNK